MSNDYDEIRDTSGFARLILISIKIDFLNGNLQIIY